MKLKVTPVVKELRIDIPKDEFALTFKAWRIENDYTQKEAAAIFGVSRFTIIRIENNKAIAWETAYKIYAKLANILMQEKK
ncbi:MAG: helix-turn-helix domain-containing protein [Clostridia bacterium]|nr:helix-turn-helix domain-containing protein [Clostridia bacterium]